MAAKTSRSWVFSAVVGLAVGSMVTGLLVAFIEGEEPASTAGSFGALPSDSQSAGDGDGPSAGDAGTTSDAETGGVGGSTPGSSGGTRTGSSSSGTVTTVAGSGGQLAASDRGVTSTTIKVAFLLLDLGQAGRIGVNTTGVDPNQQRAAYDAYIKEINDGGGINGRRIEPFYRIFDTTNPEDQRAACIAATEDAKAFAVIASPGFANAAVLCVTEEHQTPLIVTGQGLSREFYNRSRGRLTSLAMAGDRMMSNTAAEFDAKGVLDGRTIGIVSSDEKNFIDPVEGVLVPELRRLGHKVADVARLSTWPRSQGQIPPAVQRMRAAGVDTVLFVGSFLNATQWVQTADGQVWRPRYLVSEFGGMTSDFEVQAMPPSFDGALAMTSQRFAEWRSNVPEPAHDAACRETYEKTTKDSLPRNNGNESNAEYPVALYACGMVKVFAAAAQGAGANLTRSAYIDAMQRIGPMESGFYFGGAFRGGKTDLSDQLRFNRFDIGCRCWRNVDQVRPAPFR